MVLRTSKRSEIKLTMWLSKETFKEIVASTPLISIDLIVKNQQKRVLLGRRNNRPAKGFWFVPGGRIRKNETLDSAFLRLTKEEFGVIFQREDAKFLGIYQHFYQDSVFGEGQDNPSTHYIVLAYELKGVRGDEIQVNDQHLAYDWWETNEILSDESVHHYTKDYFRNYIQE